MIGRSLLAAPFVLLGITQGYALEHVSVSSVRNSEFFGNGDQAVRDACANWHLNPEDAARFLSISVEVSPEERHALYDWLPCSISGIGISNGHPISFEINAASTAAVVETDSGSKVYLGCPQEACKPLVLMPGGVPQRDMLP